MRRALVAFAVLAVGVSVRGAQQPARFAGGRDLVRVDLTAVGPDGSPVQDLSPQDIHLRVDGQHRAVVSLQYVPAAVAALERPKLTATVVTSGPADNTASPAGRIVVFVIAHEFIERGQERAPVDGAVRFLDQLNREDRVALVTMPMGQVVVDLTTEHGLLKSKLRQVIGRMLEGGAPNEYAQRTAIDALVAFLDSLEVVDGFKTVIFIAEQFPIEPGDPEVLRIWNAANRARAQFYVLQPASGLGPAGASIPSRPNVIAQAPKDPALNGRTTPAGSLNTALVTLASVTGGSYFALSGRADNFYDRVMRETAGYYLLTFEVAEGDRTGKPHEIDVQIERADVTVRARRQFTVPTREAVDSRSRTLDELSAASVLTRPVMARALPLRATAYSTRGTDGKVKLITVVQPLRRVSLKDLAIAIVDPSGKIITGSPAETPTNGTSVTTAAYLVESGPYKLRVGAIDVDGNQGSLEFDFQAALSPMQSLGVSSLMLGTETPPATFEPRLEFQDEATAVAYLEVYGSPNGALSAQCEIVSQGTEPRILSTEASVREAGGDRRVVTAQIPLSGLAAGEYFVRVSLVVANQSVGTVGAYLKKAGSGHR